MLHHVSLEIEPTEVEPAINFWCLLGFTVLPPPPALGDSSVWLERAGTQIHLIKEKAPLVPRRGHVAIIVPDLAATLASLRAAGFEVSSKRELWGSPRALAIAPGGHRVELISTAPPGSDRTTLA
jgi:hypothetical protein